MKRRTKWLIISGAISPAAVVLLAGLVGYTSTARFCASCHIMETRYISWQNSDHAAYTNCLSCHSEPGLTGELKAHLAGARYVYAYLSGRQSGPILLAEVPNENCFKCHDANSFSDNGEEVGQVHASYHRLHTEKKINCTACHGGLAHATMLPVKSRSAMALCQDCHQPQSSAVRSCNRCHPFGPGSPAVQRPASSQISH